MHEVIFPPKLSCCRNLAHSTDAAMQLYFQGNFMSMAECLFICHRTHLRQRLSCGWCSYSSCSHLSSNRSTSPRRGTTSRKRIKIRDDFAGFSILYFRRLPCLWSVKRFNVKRHKSQNWVVHIKSTFLQSLNQTQPLTVLYPQLLPLIKTISFKYTRESDVMDAVWTFIKQVIHTCTVQITAHVKRGNLYLQFNWHQPYLFSRNSLRTQNQLEGFLFLLFLSKLVHVRDAGRVRQTSLYLYVEV